MKLSDFLTDVGRPVAFYPSLVKAFGDRNEAIFICQMAYWKDKGESKEGWIYKTSEEIEQETSLTYKEQTNVRSGLTEKKLMQERYARSEHKMYFRVNWDKVNAIWEQFTDGHMPGGKVAPDQREGGSLPEVSSLNSNTETTTETTTDILKGASLDWKIAHGETVTEEDASAAKLRDEAPKMFERSFGFGTLPWGSNSVWQKFQKFVTEIYVQDQLAFGNYIVWRGTEGKYKAMSNKQIRMNPQVFMDTGWQEFSEQVKVTNAATQNHPQQPSAAAIAKAERINALRAGVSV